MVSGIPGIGAWIGAYVTMAGVIATATFLFDAPRSPTFRRGWPSVQLALIVLWLWPVLLVVQILKGEEQR